jgi:predicted transcriptional regulator
MSERTDRLIQQLQPFDLNRDEAAIYLTLLEHGQLSVLSISRKIHMGRTKVYRLLDTLKEKELVIQKHDERGFKFVAAEPEMLERQVKRRLDHIEGLHAQLNELVPRLRETMADGTPGSEVRYYRGVRGLSQVNWNLLNARGEFVSFEVTQANAYMEEHEAEKLRQELVDAKIKTRTITNARHIKPFTKVHEMVQDWWEIRYIPERELAIRADVFVYNNIYAICHYLEKGDVFCVEMENEYLAAMQKQLFEVAWGQATPLRIIGDEGEARVGK